VDWALDSPIPWTNDSVSGAGTVHVGGTLSEIGVSERVPWSGRVAERPFGLLAQPTLFDPSRAPDGKHTAWGFCHVPNAWQGSAEEEQVVVDRIEAQIERFAPRFRERIFARAVNTRPTGSSNGTPGHSHWTASMRAPRPVRRAAECVGWSGITPHGPR
jgi:phytoene dehydrogenase-like protein